MKEADLRKLLWLDLCALASRLIRKDQVLSFTKYFTARISGGRQTDSPNYRAARNEKRKRQSDYLEALNAHCQVQVIEGHYRDNEVACKPVPPTCE